MKSPIKRLTATLCDVVPARTGDGAAGQRAGDDYRQDRPSGPVADGRRPEAAAALRCVGAQFKGRLLLRNDDERARARKWGIEDLNKIYDLHELAQGDCIFAATGVTDGSLLGGVKRLKGGKMTTHSVVMRASSGTVRWVKGEHHKTV